MYGTTGRYGVEFRHATPGTWEHHQMLNTDDRQMADRALAASVQTVQRINSDVLGIRLFDHTDNAVVTEWSAAA